MLTLFFWLLLIALTFYCGWLHRRVKLLEQKAGVVTPEFAAEQERQVRLMVREALKRYALDKD